MSDWLRFLRRDAKEAADHEFTDARPVAEHVRRLSLDPEALKRVKLRRRALVLGLTGICLAGSLVALLGESGYLDMVRRQREIAELEADVARRQATVAGLQDAVRRLEVDPMARERVAREELGLVRPGEIDFLLPRQPLATWEDPSPAREP